MCVHRGLRPDRSSRRPPRSGFLEASTMIIPKRIPVWRGSRSHALDENEWALYWVVSPEEYEALDMTNTPFQKTIIPKGRVVEYASLWRKGRNRVDAYYKNFLSIPIIINKAYVSSPNKDGLGILCSTSMWRTTSFLLMLLWRCTITVPLSPWGMHGSVMIMYRYMIYVDETDVFKKMKEMEPTPLKDIQF